MQETTQVISLENGVRIVCEPMSQIKSTSVGVWVNVGTRSETKHNNGVAHFLEHLVFKGAAGRDAKQIAEEADSRGIYLNAATSYEKTGFFARCLKDEAISAFNLCADLVLEPKLDKNDIELEKNVVLHEIKEANDDAEDRANVLNQSASFRNQALGMPILGDEQSLKSLTQEKIIEFHKSYSKPQNIIIGIAGAFDFDTIIQITTERFGALTPSIQDSFALATSTSYVEKETRGIEQMQLSLSFDGAPEKEAGIFTNRLFCSILGGGMSSRLFQDLREKRGLVYNIDAFEEKFLELSRIGICAGCDPKNTDEVINRILHHIEDLSLNGPSDAELVRAKKALETSMLISLENPSSKLTSAVYQLTKYAKTFSISDIEHAIRQTTVNDIKDSAQIALAHNKRALGLVGPELKSDSFERFVN